MKIFAVMLEGQLDSTTGFFVTIEVGAKTKKEASRLAINEWLRSEDIDPRIEELELLRHDAAVTVPRVIKVYGRTYFPIED